MAQFKELVFSGVQPTGNLHLGNYLGAIKRFVTMQETHDCIYCVVDMHAITVWQDPKELNRQIREVTAAFLAAGIDPQKHIVFNQSQVAQHAELAWVFNCIARMGWANRMTQFKEKAGKDRENASVGLYAYPNLMSADILAYRATHVPVGEDQKQHLELTRDIAQKFNNDYSDRIAELGVGVEMKMGEETVNGFFPLTEPLIEEELLLVGPGRERCMAMNGPVSGEQLAELPLILPSHPHGLRVLVESLLGARKIYPNVEYEIDSLSAVVNMVERGVGYTILPYASVNSKVEDGALRVTSIIEPRMTRHLVLATSTQRPVTNATRMLAKMVTQLVRDLVREGVWLPRVSTADQYHASTSSIPAIP